MASSSPADVDRRNSPADSSSSVKILRYITNASGQGKLSQHDQKLFSCLSELLSQLLPGINHLGTANHKDVYTNETFLNLLKVITELGSCAESDLEKCLELRRHESKVFGLTGSVIDRNHEQMESSQDIPVNSVQPLPLEDRWQALAASISSGWEQMQRLESLPLVRCLQDYTHTVRLLKSNRFPAEPVASAMGSSLAQHQQMEARVEALRAEIIHEVEDLEVAYNCLDDVIEKWRRADAWIYGRIIAASTDETLCELESMFCKYFDVLTNVTKQLSKEVADDTTAAVTKKIHEIQNQVYSIAWHMNQKLQLCVLETKPISMSMRAFVLQKKDIQAVEIHIFPESDYDKRLSDKYLYPGIKPEIVDSGSQGAIVTVNNLKLKKCERAQKRNYATCCQQFYRVSFRLQSKEGRCVELLSTPFCIRTGSQQLWECVGAVTWYCFVAQDLYRQPFKCQTEMSISQLLAMLQAMILTRDPDKKLDSDEVEALADMLHSLTKTDSVNLLDFVKHAMPKQGREKSGKNDFPCFTWFVAALNTHKYLMENTNLRGCSDLAGYDQVKKRCSGRLDRSAWIRISRNEVEAASGQSPYADVVVHVYTASGVKTLVASHTKLMERALSSRVRNWIDRDGKSLVLTIQPYGHPVEELDSSTEESIQDNGYRTKFKTQTKDIVLEDDFGKMNIRGKSDTDLTDNDSSHEVPAKQARSNTCKSTAIPGRQPQFPPSADNSCLFSDIASSSDDNYEELNASISPLSDQKLQLYSKDLSSEFLNIKALPGNIQQQLDSQSGIGDASRTNALPENIRQQSNSQTGNPVPYNKKSLDELFDSCLDEDGV